MTKAFSLFDAMMLAMGLYVLVAGIRGKGRLYAVGNVKEGMEEKLNKIMRWSYVILGIFMMINSGATILKSQFYAYQEVTPATDAAAAVYKWVATKDLGAFSFLTATVLDVIVYVCLALCLTGIVNLIIAMRKMTDKNAPPPSTGDPAKDAAAARQAGHVLPVSAFDFDEPDSEDDGDPKGQA